MSYYPKLGENTNPLQTLITKFSYQALNICRRKYFQSIDILEVAFSFLQGFHPGSGIPPQALNPQFEPDLPKGAVHILLPSGRASPHT